MKTLKNIGENVLGYGLTGFIYILGGMVLVPFILTGAIIAYYIVSFFSDKIW